MNKNILRILFFAGCVLSVLGCDDSLTQEPHKAVHSLFAQVKDDASETKVSVNTAGEYGFLKGDVIGVFDSEDVVHEFTTTDCGSSVTFTNDGDVFSKVGDYAVFPYGANASASGNSVTFDMPKSYVYAEWQTNMPMLGTISDDVVTFKSAGGALMLTVYSVPSDATAMTFTASSDKICGSFTISDASADGACIEMASSEDDKSITFSFTRHQNMIFYIPLPVGTLHGFTIAFNDGSATSRTVTKEISVSRNSTIIAPALNLGSSDIWEQHPYVAPDNRIKKISWEGMYGAGDTTDYTFTYISDTDSRLASLSISGETVTFKYDDDGSISIDGSMTLTRCGNVAWIEGEPLIGYNFDGTMSRIWDDGFYRPGSSDCVWDGFDLTDAAGEATMTYSNVANVWCGVSLNAFLFAQPPGFPLINDYIACWHTKHVPSSVTSDSGTTTFSFTYDSEGKIIGGTLTGGDRDGEQFTVTY